MGPCTRRPDLIGAGIVLVAALALPRTASPADSLRGDFQPSGAVDIGDAILIFGLAFDEVPFDDPCTAAADVDGDHTAGVVDGVRLLEYLFSGGPPPAPVF